MKIFIIGPEGSGKTVMLAMLSRYVTTERKDLVFEPMDYETSHYVVAAQAELAKGEWPPSTLQGELKTLQWRFGPRGAQLHEIVMFDAAGQDLRQILLQDDKADLTNIQQRVLRSQVDAAHVLVYLLDLNGFLASRDPVVINENAWLFKAFLTRQNWRGKRRLVVLSKADTFRDMLVSMDVRDVVKCNLPGGYDHLVNTEPRINYFAVTSVMTRTVIGSDGNPVRVPDDGLKQSGLPGLVDELRKEMETGVHTQPPPIPSPPPPPVSWAKRIAKSAVYGGLVSFIFSLGFLDINISLGFGFMGGVVGALIGVLWFIWFRPRPPDPAVSSENAVGNFIFWFICAAVAYSLWHQK